MGRWGTRVPPVASRRFTPWRHLDDILRNGELFARTWGEWPMRGWIEAFVVAGAVEEHAGGFRRAVV